MTEFWFCPECKHRFWTLPPRVLQACPHCQKDALIPSTLNDFCRPDRERAFCDAYVSIDVPDSNSHPHALGA